MKKLFKFLAWAVGIVVLLVVVAVIAVPMFFDPNDYKEQIAAQVKEQTGRELQIPGDIKLSVFPWLGIDLGKVELSNAQGFAEPLFARSDKMEVRVKLMPLLQKKVEMDKVTIQGLTLNLAKNAEGGTNWDDLIKASEESVEEKPAEPSGELPIAALAIGGLDIQNASLSWDDAASGQRYDIQNLMVKTGELSLENMTAPVDLQVAFDVKGGDVKNGEAPIAGKVSVDGKVQADPDKQIFRATGLKVTTDMSGGPVPGAKANLALNVDAMFDGNQQRFTVDNLVLDAPTLGIDGASGKLALRGQVAGDLAAQTYDIKGLSLEGDMAVTKIPMEKLQFDLAADINADLGKQAVSIGGLALNVPSVKFGDISGDLALRGDVNGDLGSQAYQVSGFNLKGNVAGGPIEGGPMPFDVSADVSADMGRQTVSVKDLKLDAPDFKLKGINGALTLLAQISGNLAAQSYDINGLSLKGNVAGEAVPGDAVDLDVGAATVRANLQAQTLAVNDLRVKAADLNAGASVNVTELMGAQKFNGNLNVAPFNPRALMARLGQTPPDTADPNAMTSVSVNTGLSGSADSINLSGLALTLDDTKLNGDASVANFAAPSVRFNLAVDAINADRYLPPKAEGEAAAAGTPGAAAGAGAGLPMDMLRSLDIDGSLRVGQLKITGLDVSNASVTVKAKDGVIRATPAATLYQGQYAGNIGLDANGAEPRISMNESLTGIQVGPLLKQLQGDDKLSGRADVKVNITAIGIEEKQITQTMNGNTSFRFTDGALKGVNIGRLIRQAKATLSGQTLSAEEADVKTDFAEMSGTVQFNNGIATNNDFQAKSPLLRIEGGGTVDLVNESLDYGVTTTIVGTAAGQGGEDLQQLAGIPLPIRVTGTFTDPKYALDPGALAEAIAKGKAKELLEGQKAAALAKIEKQKAAALEKIEQQKAKALEKVQEQVGEQVGKQLGDQVGKQLGEEVEKNVGEGAKKLLKSLF